MTLRPPLPPPLTHDQISFVIATGEGSGISDEVVTEIARAISASLPAGDFEVTPSGHLAYAQAESPSMWRSVGRIESVQRSSQ